MGSLLLCEPARRLELLPEGTACPTPHTQRSASAGWGPAGVSPGLCCFVCVTPQPQPRELCWSSSPPHPHQTSHRGHPSLLPELAEGSPSGPAGPANGGQGDKGRPGFHRREGVQMTVAETKVGVSRWWGTSSLFLEEAQQHPALGVSLQQGAPSCTTTHPQGSLGPRAEPRLLTVDRVLVRMHCLVCRPPNNCKNSLGDSAVHPYLTANTASWPHFPVEYTSRATVPGHTVAVRQEN